MTGTMHPHGGVIGPNAILQTVAAVRERWGDARAREILNGTQWRLDHLPMEMVDEAEVRSVTNALREMVGPDAALDVLDEAGERTASYLLAHRIPRVAQWVMRFSPVCVSARMLLAAISRNRWTFAGSAAVRLTSHPRVVVEFAGCPLCAGLHASGPSCQFYAATFRGLFRVLVNPRVTVTETACQAVGDSCCRFVIAV